MANGMANSAAIIGEEAFAISTVGIICTTVVEGVLDVREVCCLKVQSLKGEVEEIVGRGGSFRAHSSCPRARFRGYAS
jgi:hypothetical protein